MRYIKIFIGRFQPFHEGHLKCLRAAIDTSDLVVVVVGSASNDHEPTLKNPWDHNERKAMIRFALHAKELEKVHLTDMPDMPGKDAAWIKTVKSEVKHIAKKRFPGEQFKFTLVGCHKGADTYYLKLYKGWGLDLMPQSEAMDATTVRSLYFRNDSSWSWADHIPGSSAAFLYAWKHLNFHHYHLLCQEQWRATEKFFKGDKR